MEYSYLSSDLLIQILVKLPVNSLIRFTVVSKSWHSLITSSAFISTHLTQQTPHSQTLLIRPYQNSHIKHMVDYEFYQDCKDRPFSLNFSSQLDIPFNREDGSFQIVGICNGILCLCDNIYADMPSLILWNPCIQRFKTLPFPTISRHRGQKCVFGFGANNDNDDYKLVRIVYFHHYTEFKHGVLPRIEIYSLSTGVWRRLTGVGIKHYIIDFWSKPCVKGNLHWLALYMGDKNELRHSIVSFNVANEVFGEIMLPDALVGEQTTNLSIMAFEGSLVTVRRKRERHGDSAEVWVMKQYDVFESWTKLYGINLVSGMERVVGFRSNGEVLLTWNNKLASYDPNTGQSSKDLGIRGLSYLFYVENYKESLALLQGSNVVTMSSCREEQY